MAQLDCRPDIKHAAASVKDALDKVFGWTGPQLLEIRDEAAVLLLGAIQVNPYLWSLGVTMGITNELVSTLDEAKEGMNQLAERTAPLLIVKLACKILKGKQKEAKRWARLNS